MPAPNPKAPETLKDFVPIFTSPPIDPIFPVNDILITFILNVTDGFQIVAIADISKLPPLILPQLLHYRNPIKKDQDISSPSYL